jgi:uncharacterized protein (DUF1697 family)
MPSKEKPPLTTYVALLRGINVGGNNMILMASLKASFEQMDFTDVSTYINSGNIIFKAKEDDARRLESDIEMMLRKEYELDCKVVVRSFADIAILIKRLPAIWNGDPEWRYNVIFLRHSIDSKKILEGLHPKPGIEKVTYLPGTLLWCARAKDVARSAMVKLPGQKIYQDMTVRNLNTTRKLFELMKKASEN